MAQGAAARGIEIKVGILVTVCLVLLGLFIWLLGDFGPSSGQDLFIDVESSASLKPGAPVKIAGVSAGRVTAIDYRGGAIDPKTNKPVLVRVHLSVDGDKLKSLNRDAQFYITTQGVLGEKYVEISPVPSAAPSLAAGDVVNGEPPLRLEMMALNANRVLRSLDRVLKKNEDKLSDIITETHSAVANANETMKVIRRAVERVDGVVQTAEPKVSLALDEFLAVEQEVKSLASAARSVVGDGSELRETIGNVRSLTGQVKSAVKPVVGDVRAALARYSSLATAGKGFVVDAKAFVADAKTMAGTSLGKVDRILEDIQVLSGRLKDGQGTIGALLSDREMYDDIREMMKDLRRHPWKFIWKE